MSAIGPTPHGLAPFRDRDLFFGGVQAVERDADGRFWGGGDPRRGGASIVVDDGASIVVDDGSEKAPSAVESWSW